MIKYKLTAQQSSLWFEWERNPKSTAFNLPHIFKLNGKLKKEILENGLKFLVNRHDALRTFFERDNDKIFQKIVPELNAKINFTDLSLSIDKESDYKKRDILNKIVMKECNHVFNIKKVPLFKFSLIKVDKDGYYLILNFHHIISDGVSIDMFLKELSYFYKSKVEQTKIEFSIIENRLDFFLENENQYINSEKYIQDIDMWKTILKNAVFHIPFPAKYYEDKYSLMTIYTIIPADLTRKVKKLCKELNTTLFLVLETCFIILLFQFTGQADITINYPINNKPKNANNLFGYFVNLLFSRTQIDQNLTFKQLIYERIRYVNNIKHYKRLPVSHLIKELRKDRIDFINEFSNVLFGIFYFGDKSLQLPGIKITAKPRYLTHTQNQLSFGYSDLENKLKFMIWYSDLHFDEFFIKEMVKQYQQFLDIITKNPDQRICNLPLMDNKKKFEIVYAWNNKKFDYFFKKGNSLSRLFEELVKKYPDNPAISFQGKIVTYDELNKKSNQLACYLIKRYKQTFLKNLQPNAIIAIAVNRGIAMILGILSILKAGAAYLPLDPDYPSQRVKYILEDAKINCLMIESNIVRNHSNFGLDENFKELALTIEFDENSLNVGDFPDQDLSNNISAEDLAYVIYTSGSTGTPKGVAIQHKSILNTILYQINYVGITKNSKILQFASFAFDASVWEIFGALLRGAMLSLNSKEELLPGSQLEKTLLTQAISIVTLPPSVLNLLPQRAYPNLKTIIIAGEALPTALMKKWSKKYRCINAYGPTETAICASMKVCHPKDYKPLIGKPIANINIYILNTSLSPVPVGVIGEIYIGGIGLAKEYLNNIALTQEKFIANPFSEDPESRIYKSGDLARWLPDGNIDYIGRNDQQIKIRGYRVELGEIESMLRSHPDVSEAVVLIKDISETQTESKQLIAYLVAQTHSLNSPEIYTYLKKLIPIYMIPSTFIFINSLPLTASGKIDKQSLVERDIKSLKSMAHYVLPRTPEENDLINIWAEIIKLDPATISIYDNFFMLGGDSLLLAQVISRIRVIFRVEVSISALFENNTIASLIAHIHLLRQKGNPFIYPPLTAHLLQSPIELSFAQKRLWFLDYLQPQHSFYNISVGFMLDGDLNIEVLEKAYVYLIHRHQSLRAFFITEGNQVLQHILPPEKLQFRLSVVSLPIQDNDFYQLESIANAEAQQPFDLSRPPLLRIKLIQITNTKYLMLITLHHIITDAWSMQIFYRELSLIYNAFLQKKPIVLSSLTEEYSDFVLWQRQCLKGESYQRLINYWKKKLDHLTVIQFPTDYIRPKIQTYNGKTIDLNLSPNLTDQLNQLINNANVTLFTILIAIYFFLLKQYSNQSDLTIGIPIAGRTVIETENIIGLFINSLVIHSELSHHLTFMELLQNIHQTVLEAYAYQELPFEKLVEALNIERDSSRNPLFQFMFVFNNIPQDQLDLPHIHVSNFQIHHKNAKVDITLSFEKSSDKGLQGFLIYNTDLFKEESIQRLRDHYLTLVEAVIKNPEQQINQLSLLTPTEYDNIIYKWNATSADYPCSKTLHELFEDQVSKTLNQTAVIFKDQCLTYQELNAQSNQLAHYLRSLYVNHFGKELSAGALLAVMMERSFDMVVSILGILKAGGAYVPIDPDYPTLRIQYMLRDSEANVVITNAKTLAMCSKILSKLNPPPICIILEEDWQSIKENSIDNLQPIAKAEDLAYVIYTSGSTGQPKGVMNVHRAIVNRLWWMQNAYQLTDQDRILQKTSFSFDVSIWEFFWPLVSGAQLILAEPGEQKDSHAIVCRIIHDQISTIHFVPSMLAAFLIERDVEQCTSLKRVICSGEALSYSLQQLFFQKLSAKLYNLYGPTEAAIDVSAWECKAISEYTSVPIGKPISNIELYVLNRYLQPVPVGVIGELYIGGVGLARGYLHQPKLTAERFIVHPFKKDKVSRLYKTGDLVFWRDDGNLEYVGRNDDQIKIRGFRIELGEIIAQLETYSGIHQAVVLSKKINEDAYLISYLVAENKIQLDIEKIRAFLQKKLPDYMVPHALTQIESIPLTPSGKVDKKALLEMEVNQINQLVHFVPARNAEEQSLINIWAEVLKIDPATIGINDNFFALGGHSLLATQVFSRIRSLFQVELPLTEIFVHPTIAQLIDKIQKTELSSEMLKRPILKPRPLHIRKLEK